MNPHFDLTFYWSKIMFVAVNNCKFKPVDMKSSRNFFILSYTTEERMRFRQIACMIQYYNTCKYTYIGEYLYIYLYISSHCLVWFSCAEWGESATIILLTMDDCYIVRKSKPGNNRYHESYRVVHSASTGIY